MNQPNQAAAGVALLLWSTDPHAPHLLAAPFMHAASAAAMDVTVEIYFTARSVHLLVPGVAEAIRLSAGGNRTVLELMREAVAQGARLLACSDALQTQGIDAACLIAECTGRGGAVQFMARTLVS